MPQRCETPEPEAFCTTQAPAVDVDDWEIENDESCDETPQQHLHDLLLHAPWQSGKHRVAHAPITPSPLGPNAMNDQWVYCSKNRSILEGTWTRYTGDGEALLTVDAVHGTWHNTKEGQENPIGTILWVPSMNDKEPVPVGFCATENTDLYDRARAMVQTMPGIKECRKPFRILSGVLTKMPAHLEDFREELWFSLDDENGTRRFQFVSFCSPLPLDPSYFYIYELDSSDKLNTRVTGSSNVDGVVIKLNFDNARKPTSAYELQLDLELSLVHWVMLCWHEKYYNL
ncbi:hypothetical protein MD484_g1617, partial [Candolleomyces efflorescens]